ncbi:MAG: Fe-S cluster assembly ATPase SufC [Candidatus Lightella neohaematopini]|nr:Fe-S cluster assembly ATPase SufC [Candidatus Lightella neohaematopini]MCV2528880.1 Fe-S cluster assembly ATPase SufC [Candidatus Lightella neohaematopini]
MLVVENLDVSINNNIIIKKLNLIVNRGEVHIIMGPNGSGKSTLSAVIAGNKKYNIINGKIIFNNNNLLDLNSDERARCGIFIAFQYPIDIPGVSNFNFLKTAINNIRKSNNLLILNNANLISLMKNKIKSLKMSDDLLHKCVNVGLSGGERKLNEVLQLLLLEPKLCILDEIDSGLDIDSLKLVANTLNSMRNKHRSFIIITHYQRILKYIEPDKVHILYNGCIIKSGNKFLVEKLEEYGYDWFTK